MPFHCHLSISNIRSHRCSIPNRAGVAAIEFALVLALIILVAVVAVQTLGTSARTSLAEVSQQIGSAGSSRASRSRSSQAADAPSTETPTISAAERIKERSARAEQAVAICVFCIVVIGGLYLRLYRKQSGNLKRKEEEVEEIHKRSLALRQVLAKRNSIFTRIDDNWETILNGHAKVETYMSGNVVSIGPEVPKADALLQLTEAGFRRFMVVRSDGTLAGVVSRKDIVTKPGERVCDVMTGRPRIATPDTEIQTALSVLLENRISCLPVVKDKKLVGILSVSDLLMVLQCLLRDLSTRQIDPDHVAAQHPHDRCELVPESGFRSSERSAQESPTHS